jgi:hypothetical protein
MKVNFLALLAATAVPMIIGMIWYNPKIGFGKAWMAVTGVTPEDGKKQNMALVFGLTALFSFFISLVLQMLVIHQFSIDGILRTQADSADPNGESMTMLNEFMSKYGHSYRTFKHGAFHGTLAGILFAMPVLAINAMFEGKRFKYIAINAGFWIVCLALMGGVICQFT